MRERLRGLPSKNTLRGLGATLTSAIFALACQSPVAPPPPTGEVLGASTGPDSGENFYLGESDTTGQVLGASIGPMSVIFPEFINEYKGTAPDYDKHFGPQCADVVNFWSKKQGGKQFIALHSADFFGQNPEFYDSIPRNTQNLPQQGDIIDWQKATWNGGDGHVAIVDHMNPNGTVTVWEENGPISVEVQKNTYAITDDVEGWIRARQYEIAPTEAPPPNSAEILNQYLSTENITQEDSRKLALRFWFDLFTTKESTSTLYDGQYDVRLTTNLAEWAPNIQTFINITDYLGQPTSEKIDEPFIVNFDITRHDSDGTNVHKTGEIHIEKIFEQGLGKFTEDLLSEEDRAKGIQFIGELSINYMYSTSFGNFEDWQEAKEVISWDEQSNIWTMNRFSAPLYQTYDASDPADILPNVVGAVFNFSGN